MKWKAVDLDGTLAQYDASCHGKDTIGPPVPRMIRRVKAWIAAGIDVRIFTARPTQPYRKASTIEAWCEKHIGKKLPITNVKDCDLEEIWDDKCIQIIPNTGFRADGKD